LIESPKPSLSHITNDTYTKPPPGVDQNLTIFIGIMTYYEKIDTREFILGLPEDENKDKLEEESKMYGDIVILNITENMNEGKTFEYFIWFAKHV
ncbi:5945_t:CDS:2, partial [Racocetra persica]